MYSYYNAETSELDFENMVKDMKNMQPGTVVLLHACAHNPTGYELPHHRLNSGTIVVFSSIPHSHFFFFRMDPTLEQWKQISEICKDGKLLPFFDCAYQGFASGCADKDAAALRMFVDDGHLMCMVQSFSKNFGTVSTTSF